MKKSVYILAYGICLLFLTSCKKKTINQIVMNESLLIEGTAFMVTENQRIPVILQHENGGKVAMVDDDVDGRYDQLVYQDNNSEIVMQVDEISGLPKKMFTSNGQILLYEYKENNTLLDLAILNENGDVNYIRDIDISNFSNLSAKHLQSFESKNSTEKVKEVVSALSLAWSMGVCVVSGSLAATGVGLLTAAISCTSFIAQLGIYYQESTNADTTVASAVSNATYLIDYFGCTTGNIPACVSTALGSIDAIEGLSQVMTESVGQENINLAESALLSGYGAVKVTLTWSKTSDIDLWVTDPKGERVYFDNPFSSSGGVLDIDDQNGPGTENIFWKENPPLGEYLVQVHYYEDNGGGAIPYIIQIETEAFVQKVNGVLSAEGQLDNVSNFTVAASQKAFSTTELKSSTTFNNSIAKKSKD